MNVYTFEVFVDGTPVKNYVNYFAAKRYSERFSQEQDVEIRYFLPHPNGANFAPLPRGCDRREDGIWKHYDEVDTGD